MGARGSLAGVLSASGTLVALAFVSLGFYASTGGLLIAGTLALVTGTVAAALVDARPGRHAAIVAGYITVLLVVYIVVFSFLSRPTQPGVTQGGPAVPAPDDH